MSIVLLCYIFVVTSVKALTILLNIFNYQIVK